MKTAKSYRLDSETLESIENLKKIYKERMGIEFSDASIISMAVKQLDEKVKDSYGL